MILSTDQILVFLECYCHDQTIGDYGPFIEFARAIERHVTDAGAKTAIVQPPKHNNLMNKSKCLNA